MKKIFLSLLCNVSLLANVQIGLGGAYVPATGSITINGTAQNYTTNPTFTVSGGGGSSLGYDITQYGCVGNGTTDNSSALSTLLLTTAPSGSNIYVPPGNFAVNSAISISNKCFHFIGTPFASVISTTANITVLTISSTTNTANNWSFTGLTFSGNNAGASQGLVRFKVNASLFNIANCVFQNFNSRSLEVDSTDVNNFLGGSVDNCTFINNPGYAIYLGKRGEYVKIKGCNINGNGTGIFSIAGNTIIEGDNINHNIVSGIEFAAGVNNSHSIVSACNINHNLGYGIKARNCVNGLTIQGVHMYSDSLRIDSSSGIMIVGGEYDLYKWIFTNNTNVYMTGIYFPNANTNIVTITGTTPTRIGVFGTPPTALSDQSGGAVTSYTPTVTGASGSPSASGQYFIVGKSMTCFFQIQCVSNSTLFTITMPFASSGTASTYNCGYVRDNNIPFLGVFGNGSGSNIINIGLSTPTGTFTASGAKWAYGQITVQLP